MDSEIILHHCRYLEKSIRQDMRIQSLLLSLLGSVSLAGSTSHASTLGHQRCQEIRAHTLQSIETLRQDLANYKQKTELLRVSFGEGRCRFERETCELALKAGQAVCTTSPTEDLTIHRRDLARLTAQQAVDEFETKIKSLEEDLERKCPSIPTPPTILSSQPQGMTPLQPYFAYPSPAEIPPKLCFMDPPSHLPSNAR